MNPTWNEEVKRILLTYAVPFAGRVVGAIALWIIGRILISLILGLVRRNLGHRNIDVTLARYVNSILSVLLSILLLIAILSVFGIETASFAGILAAGGIAIGMAWAGLLSNFAAGVFLVVLRPFKVGDVVSVAGVTGTVAEIGLFASALDTPDNIRTIVGNSKIFGDTIRNFSTNPHRSVDLKVQLPNGVDPDDAIQRLREPLSALPNVMKTPAPAFDIVEINASGPVLGVHLAAHDSHYGAIYGGALAVIHKELSKAGYPSNETHHVIRKVA